MYRILGWAVLGLLGYQASLHFAGDDLRGGLLYLLLGAALRVVGSPRWDLPPSPTPPTAVPVSCHRNIAGLALLSISGGAFLLAAHLFDIEAGPQAWHAYALGALALLGGGVLHTRGGDAPRASWGAWMVVGLALLIRLYDLDSLPYGIWLDEALSGLEAQRTLAEPDYRPSFAHSTSGPALMLYALALQMFGVHSITALRLVFVLLGTGAVLGAYLAGREAASERVGLWMALWLALSYWAINISRLGMTGMGALCFTLWCGYFLLRLWRTGDSRAALWLGVCLALGLWSYQAFRPIALWVVLWVGVYAWRRRGWGRLGWVLAPALLALMPYALHPQPADLSARADSLLILHAENRPGQSLPAALMSNLRRYAEMFHIRGDANPRHNLSNAPQLDRLSGVLFAWGLLLGWRSPRPLAGMFFGGVLLLALLTGALTRTLEAPHALRSLVALAAVAYFVALAGEMLRLPLMVFMLLAALNLPVYFVQMRDHSAGAFHLPQSTFAYLALDHPDSALYLPPDTETQALRFAVPGFAARRVDNLDDRPLLVYVPPHARAHYDHLPLHPVYHPEYNQGAPLFYVAHLKGSSHGPSSSAQPLP